MPTYGGYTGRHIRPISLAATATLAQLTDLPICGVGGVEDYRSILEFIMLGAAAAQLGSAIMLHGYDLITKTVRALEDWMQAHGYDDYSSITGAALSSLTPFEKAVHRRAVCRMTQPCSRTGCGLCTCGCMYGTLVMEPDGVHLNSSQCTGCGLCVQRCPQDCFTWKRSDMKAARHSTRQCRAAFIKKFRRGRGARDPCAGRSPPDAALAPAGYSGAFRRLQAAGREQAAAAPLSHLTDRARPPLSHGPTPGQAQPVYAQHRPTVRSIAD